MLHCIIDGYNVLHSIPSLHKTLLHDAESARELLIDSVAQLTYKNKIRCSIVFDGTAPHPVPKHSSHAPVHVLYSFPLSADTKIKQLIEKSKNRSKLIIISSDREILNHAKTFSCQTHTSKHFASLLSDTTDTMSEKIDQPLTKTQIDEWLTIFGER